MCMYDTCETADLYRASVHRTRRQRKCEECGRQIMSGERYHYAFMLYERSPSTFNTCEHCAVAQEWLIRECGGHVHGALWQDIDEHITEYPRLLFPLGRLIVGQRRQWRDMPVPAVPSATIHQAIAA